MPTYEITSPEGNVYHVDAPEGASEQDALKYVQDNHDALKAMPVEKPTAGPDYSSRLSRFEAGMTDPGVGAGQLAVHAIPSDLKNPVTAALDATLGKVVGLGQKKLPTKEDIDAEVSARESAIKQGEDAAGVKGVDWMRLAGNVASPVNYVVPGASAEASLGSVALAGAGQGLTTSALQPVDNKNGDYWNVKGKQVAFGAASGAIAAPFFRWLGKPGNTDHASDVALLSKEGVDVLPGQAIGGAAKTIEEKLKSLPVVGDAITAGDKRGLESFNRAAVNRSLAPIGDALPKGIVGQDAIQYADKALGGAYDNLLPKLKVGMDDEFVADFAGIEHLAQEMPETQFKQLGRILNGQVMDKFSEGGMMTGASLKEAESTLGRLAKGYSASPDYDQQRLGSALREAQASLRRATERSNPEYQGELQKINEGWANFVRVRDAASRIGAKNGIFSPAILRSAVRAADASAKKGSFAKGQALMQDLADAGVNVLGKEVPDSGTPGRLLMNLGVLGGTAATHPYALAGILGASALYSRPATRLMQAAITSDVPGAALARGALGAAARPVVAGLATGAASLAAPAGP